MVQKSDQLDVQQVVSQISSINSCGHQGCNDHVELSAVTWIPTAQFQCPNFLVPVLKHLKVMKGSFGYAPNIRWPQNEMLVPKVI